MLTQKKTQNGFFACLGIGGGIITKKLLFAVLLIASLSLSGIATASAAEVGTTQKQTSNTNTLIKDINTQSKSENISKNSTNTQKTVEKDANVDKKDNYTKSTSTQNKNSQKTTTEIKNNVVKNVKSEAKSVSKNTQPQTTTQNTSTVTKNTNVSVNTNIPVKSGTEASNTQSQTQLQTISNDVSKETVATISTNIVNTDTSQTLNNQNTANVYNNAETTTKAPVTTESTTQSSDAAKTVITSTSTEPVQTAVNPTTTTDKPVQTLVTPTTTQTTDKPVTNTVSTSKPQAAAGDVAKTTTVAPTNTATKSFTVTQVKSASVRVKAFIDKYHRLPNYVTIGPVKVKMSDFLKLMVIASNQIKNGVNKPISYVSVNGSVKPLETVKTGKINQAGYLDLSKRVQAYVDAYGKLPNYANTSLGKMKFESLIYMYSKILNFQSSNNRLLSYVTVNAWSTAASTATGTVTNVIGSAVPADLKSYLLATANCQVNNAQIKSLAASITRGSTSTYDKGAKIFNWVRDNLSYSFYYNTRYGAVGALNARTGNCVDTAHLVIALSRAAGLPARYVHANARFTSGHVYGHVWAQVWVNGKWYTADGTSSRNSFGAARNWSSATIKGIYKSLPF